MRKIPAAAPCTCQLYICGEAATVDELGMKTSVLAQDLAIPHKHGTRGFAAEPETFRGGKYLGCLDSGR